MSQTDKNLLVVLDCCVGCHACEIACRQEHNLSHDAGSRWCRVMTLKPRRVEEELYLDYFPVICVHCEAPLCLQVCPVGAIAKREDGIVVIKGDACNGCRLCVAVCPQGAMSFNELTGEAGKCDLCLERVEHGIEPSCVQHCIGGALRYVTLDDLQEITKGKHAVSFGKVHYASSQWKFVP